jgi:hypothetical protein
MAVEQRGATLGLAMLGWPDLVAPMGSMVRAWIAIAMRCFIAGVWRAHREKFRSSALPRSIVAGAIYPAMDHLSLPRETVATQVLEPDNHKAFIHRQHCVRDERAGAADH